MYLIVTHSLCVFGGFWVGFLVALFVTAAKRADAIVSTEVETLGSQDHVKQKEDQQNKAS
jgi:hypothetical protein